MAGPYVVPSVKRAFEILELLAREDSGLTISQIHRQLDLPLSSVATIMYTLENLGYLERSDQNPSYRLGSKLFNLTRGGANRPDIVAPCHGLLEEAVRQTGLTGHLAILKEGDSMYVDRVAGKGLLQVSTYVGLRWPAHTSAAGKALLAFRPQAEIEELLSRMTLKKLTAHTITSKRELVKQLAGFRRLGYAWELNEGEMGLGCVSAPVFGADGKVVAAVSFSGTTMQIDADKIPSLGALVKQCAERMSKRSGYEPPP
jgi:DNA-binding IclR family transcriptional regulator